MSLPIDPHPDPRLLVPLETLQNSLYRQLYPQDFDFIYSFQMSNPPPASQIEDAPPPPSPTSSSRKEATPELRESSPPNQRAPSSPTSTSTPTVVAEQTPSPGHQCQWVDCDKSLPDPESLYNHLCNDHIGRKSTGNLCLTCKWKDCGTSCAKRDHITSHLRVHTPLKPHVCEICKKPFKRPQDLKKHEKIHTEEHHAQHKHSKAITVADPNFSSRVRGDLSPTQKNVSPLSRGSRVPSDKLQQVPVARAKSLSISEGSSDFGVLPTPSPDIAHSPIHYSHPHDLYSLQNHLPSWEVLRPDGSSATVTPGAAGSKRSYDYGMGDFFTDVKKRRVAPAYDPHMIERLNSLSHSQSLSTATGRRITVGPPSHPSSFNPRSVSFDIRSPEELAAVNEFLITLGRDVSHGPNVARPPHSQSAPMNPDDYGSAPNYFDPSGLSQLGLAGMPGVPSAPGSGSGYSGDAGYASGGSGLGPQPPSNYPSRSSHQSVQYGLYPPVNELRSSMYPSPEFGSSHSRRISLSPSGSDDIPIPRVSASLSTPFHQSPSHFLSPVHDSMGGTSPFSSHSALSTPPGGTPPHLHMPDDLSAFDYVRPSRAPPTVQLAPVDLATRTHRNMVRLQTAPHNESIVASRPEPMEPKITSGSVHRGPPAKLSAQAVASLSSPITSLTARPSTSSSTTPAISSLRTSSPHTNSSLYPLLTSGDQEYRLPPLQHKHRYRSPSPPVTSSPLSRASTLSPAPENEDEDEEGDHRMRSSTHSGSTGSGSQNGSGSSTPSPPPVLPSFQTLVASQAPSAPHRPSALRSDLEDKLSRIALDPNRPLSLSEVKRRLSSPGSSSAGSSSAREIGDVTPEQRVEHAILLRDLLVSINTEYKRKFGTPPPAGSKRSVRREVDDRKGEWEGSRDVEMIGA